MTRLNMARLFLYSIFLVTVLNMLGILPILTYMLPVLLLGLFINVVQLQYDVIVLGHNLNESYTFLGDTLYQMEIDK